MKKILCLDGGGAKGIIPATVLAEIEANLGKRIYQVFDLIVGSSVGAIIGGILAIDAMTASKLQEAMMETLPDIFKRRLRIPILQPKYSRRMMDELLSEHIGFGTAMSYCETKYMCTGVNMVDGRTHFFKSWEEKDGEIPLAVAITRSYAAPFFFGPVIDESTRDVWLDGGTGLASCPLNKTYIEIQRQRWHNERVHVLSIGCGDVNFGVPFDKAKKYRNIRQVLFYNNPTEGGLAREQATGEQVTAFQAHSEENPNLTFQRLNIRMPKKEDGMDKIKYLSVYERYGKELAEEVDYESLRGL